MNYFSLFDLPERPRVDHTFVSNKYIQLQKQFHPDRFAGADPDAKDDALQKSAEVNKAYRTFKNDDKTLAYFLEIKGVLEPGEKFELPANFLMEVMELNENLMEGNEADTQKLVEEFEQVLNNEAQPILRKASEAPLSDAELQALKSYHFKRKYLQRILARMED